jgi:hypothetical protein
VPESQPLPGAAVAAIPWIKAASVKTPGQKNKAASVKTLRPKTMIDCLAAVDRHEADALVALEPEARLAIEKLITRNSFKSRK